MPNITQPDATNNTGVVVTIGIVTGNDRCAIVLPLGTDDPGMDTNNCCIDAVDSVNTSITTLLTACLSSGAYVSFIAGEGMVDGTVPYRMDFNATVNQGTRGAGPLPSQVAALIFFYRDTAHEVGTPRIKLGKNFIPGIAHADVSGDLIVDDLYTALAALADMLQNGFETTTGPTYKWYRYLKSPVPRTEGTALTPTFIHGARGYVGTQRRRLIPR